MLVLLRDPMLVLLRDPMLVLLRDPEMAAQLQAAQSKGPAE